MFFYEISNFFKWGKRVHLKFNSVKMMEAQLQILPFKIPDLKLTRACNVL